MKNSLAIIKRLQEQHKKVRSQLDVVGKVMGDKQAIYGLEKVRSDLFLSKPGAREQLVKDLEALDEGLQEHFNWEEPDFKTLFMRHGSEVFITAFLSEHEEIRQAIDDLTNKVKNQSQEGKSVQECLAEEFQISSSISHLRSVLEDHARREDTILELVKRVIK